MNVNYRPEIDSLRAASVIAVILFHLEIFNVSGGFLGVDVFFVISGFLISNFITLRLNNDNFSFLEFYTKRTKRLFPALFVVSIFTLFIGYFKFQPESFKFLSLTVSSILLFVSNILFYFEATYFNDLATQSPLLHTWSLSVEEQFYLFFPLMAFVCIKWINKKTFLVFIIFLISISLLLSQLNSENLNRGYFFLLQSRVFELGFGVLCSYTLIYKNSKIEQLSNKFELTFKIIPVISIFVILASFFIFNESSILPGLYSLFPVMSAALFILTVQNNVLLLRILSNKFFVMIGKMSYSLYLWHFPIIIFYPDLINYSNFLYYIIILFTISFLSWKYIEQPFRLNNFIEKKFLIVVFILNLFLIVICIFIYKTNGLKNNYLKNLNLSESQILVAVDNAQKNKNLNITDECKFADKNTTTKFVKRVNYCLKKHKKFILIIGDSHGTDVFNSIAYFTKHPFIIGLAQGSCRPDMPKKLRKKCHYQNSINFVHYYKNHIKSIIYSQKGSYLLTNYRDMPILEESIETTMYYLKFLSTQKKYPIIWLGPNAEPNIDLKNNILETQKLLLNNKKLYETENQNIYKVDIFLKNYLKDKDVLYVSKLDLIKFDITKDFYVNKNFTYSDTDHWSAFGEKFFGNRMFASEVLKKYLD